MIRTIGAILGAIVVILVLVTGLTVRMSPPSRTGWKEFSIGPASGYSASINPGAVRADGISLLTAVSVAYGVPAVRIVAPGWVADTRYTIVAEAPTWDSDLFRELFLAEMKARFALEAHREKRGYDVFVLAAGKVHDLEKAGDDEPNTRIGLDKAELRGASMDRLAGAVQSILGKPVINETDISGAYRFTFVWGEDRVAALAAALRNKFGLELTPGKRDLDALVVDRIEADGATSILGRIGRLTSGAPSDVRRTISNAFTIR